MTLRFHILSSYFLSAEILAPACIKQGCVICDLILLCNSADYLQQQVMDGEIPSHDVGVIRPGTAAVNITDKSTGLPDQQSPGGNVPLFQPVFPKPIQTTAGNVGKIQRGCPRPSYTGSDGS